MGQASSSSLSTSLPSSFPPNAIVGQMPEISGQDASTWIYLYRIPLQCGRYYSFNDSKGGSFIMMGGSCGSFTLELDDPTRTINIADNRSVFSAGASQRGIRVTIQDNPKVLGFGDSSIILTAGGDPAEKKLPIPIRAVPAPNNTMFLRGKRPFTVTGDGSVIYHSGYETVTVNGNPLLLQIQDIGSAVVHGSINGDLNVSKISCREVTVHGNVAGRIFLEGGATIEVKGDVRGDIIQNGTGMIRVRGKHYGTVHVNGLGSVRVYNN